MRRRLCNPAVFAAGIAFLSVSVLSAPGAFASGRPSDADRDVEPSLLVATGDLNGDGIPDIIRVQSAPASISVMIGDRGGSYSELPAQPVPAANPTAIAVADFNHDNNLDVIVGDAAGALFEFLGDGHGALHPAGIIAHLGSVVSLATGRFTRDPSPGLVVSDLSSNSAAILLPAPDGSFHLAWSFALPKRGTEYHLATADFNQDGIADLVLTTEDSDDYEVMLGNGNGTFTYAPQLSHLKDPNSYCPT